VKVLVDFSDEIVELVGWDALESITQPSHQVMLFYDSIHCPDELSAQWCLQKINVR
jgi:hypothetical protein